MKNLKTLAASRLAADPRLAQAKKLLQDAVADHQSTLTGIRPPLPSLNHSYEKLLETLTEARGAPLWFPYLGSGIGKGALVELLDGSVKLDFITGIGTHYFGHSHPALLSAGIDAALSDIVMQGQLQQNGDAVALSELLLKASGMDHLFLSSSGAMANENALKIAFQKRAPASRILTFDHCFTGRTLLLAQITDKPNFREGLPFSVPVDYVPFYDPARPEESSAEAVATLKKHLTRYPNQHAAMIFELVQGEGGIYPGTRPFFVALMSLLKEHNIPIIDDEIQSFGRLPELFAYQYFNLESYIDICTIGKLSLACATFFRKELAPRKGLLSQTFTASTSAIRSSLTLLKQLQEGNYYGPHGRITEIHNRFTRHFDAIAKRHPTLISGPYGLGGMVAFTPHQGVEARVIAFVKSLYKAGLMSFTAGSNPTRVRFLVPVGVVTDADIDTAAEIVEKVLTCT